MGAQSLSSRAVIGEFYSHLEQLSGMGWIGAISMLFNTDQESETYPWLGQVPQMQEWIGGRHAKGFRENGITIKNRHFEATIEILVRDMRRDKTGQVMTRIRELATRTDTHWASLMSTLIINGESTVCYDGQFFFDTDHSEGDSGTQSNDITTEISTLPVPADEQGSVTDPSVKVMRKCIQKSVTQMYGYLDDQGEPINETAKNFLVMVPVPLFDSAQAAVSMPFLAGGESNELVAQNNFRVLVATNPRLIWTDKFATFRTDGETKPFIRQQETEVDLKVKAEGSEFEFDNDAHQYGVDAWRNVGNGMWQHAVLNQLV